MKSLPELTGGIIFISPGVKNDGGGFYLYVGSDGKLHIGKVPPWDPNGPGYGPSPINDLVTATELMVLAETKGAAMSQKLERLAEELVSEALPAVAKVVARNVKEPVR